MINICGLFVVHEFEYNCSLCFYGVSMHEDNCQRVAIQFTVSLGAQIVLVP